MNNSSNIEPFVLKSIDEIEEVESTTESAFISFFQETQQHNKIESEENNDLENNDLENKTQEIDIEAEARRIFEDAYREGEKAGFEMGMKKVEPIIKRLNGELAAIESFKETLLKKVEDMSIELAFLFAEAIILKECTENRDIIVNMVKKALEICEDKYDIKIRMRSSDIKYISEENIKTLNIVPDDTIAEPGFIIETNFGEIDGKISTQIDELKRQILTQKQGE
ncbi:MAG TPA: FliH/SctL family protein [Syntrophorhabdaceae bacterium]|nr:FliH/SctL family protein [Syntrophorhabdaceae bacterium]